jgi:MFS family permease
MLLDLSPLKKNRDFRYLYVGQFISFFGTMMSFVALPYQVYQLTGSTLVVGFLGVVELVPLLITAFIGGALADVMDRRKLLIYSELGMAIGCGVLLVNTLLAHPSVWLIFIISACLSAINGIHRPSLDSMTPRLVKHDEIQSAAILTTFKATVGMIAGPALAGMLIATVGLTWTYALDLFTFAISIAAIAMIKAIPRLEAQNPPSLKSVVEAMRYAISRKELLGTYVVDFAAMVFAMPNALYPAIAQSLNSTKWLGWLYTAPAVGAFLITVFSGWTKKVIRHGRAVVLAALLWGFSIIAFGAAGSPWWMLFFLMLAGAADSVSGIFRMTIWNETIPDNIRGRMASLEMISYMSGPLLGNAQAGLMAASFGLHQAIMIGGTLCIIGVILSALLLPRFWNYVRN